MKIAIESNDGVTIKSPFMQTTGYLVYDVEQSGIKGTEYRRTAAKSRTVDPVTKPPAMVNDCKTVISRGMNRSNLQSFTIAGSFVNGPTVLGFDAVFLNSVPFIPDCSTS